jgi:hypothetical protein
MITEEEKEFKKPKSYRFWNFLFMEVPFLLEFS